jgi:two-component system CheB/CheR fusion protein
MHAAPRIALPSTRARLAWPAAVLLALASVALDFAVQQLTGARAPFVAYFPAVIFVAYFAGRAPAALVLAIGAVAGSYAAQLVTPAAPVDGEALTVIGLFVAAAVTSIAFVAALRDLVASVNASRERLGKAHVATGAVEWQWDLATGHVSLSESAREVFGASWTGTGDAWPLAHPDDLAAVQAAITAGLERDGYSFRSRMIRPDTGAVRWIETKAVVHRGAHGKPTHVTGVTIDVTDRQAALERAAASERQAERRATEIEAVLDAVPAVIWIAHDPECRHVSGSRAAYEALRLPPRGSLELRTGEERWDHFRLVDADGRTLEHEELPLYRAASTGAPQLNFRTDVVFTDGTRRVLFGSAHPLRDPDGTVTGAVAALADVTELMEAESALQRVAEEYEQIVKLAPIGIVVARDPGCTTITRNAHAEQLFRTHVGTDALAAAPPLAREGYEVRSGERALAPAEMPLQRAAASGRPVSNELLHVTRPDGSQIEIVVSAVPLLAPDGSPRGAIATLQDVTEFNAVQQRLQDSEEQLRLAVEGADLGMWVTDLAARSTRCNARNLEIFGLPADSGPVPDARWNELIHPEDRPAVLAAWEHSFAELDTYALDYRIRRPDGTVRWVESRARFHLDEAGRPLRVIGVTLDVTHRKETEAALREANLRKDEFLATLAHELRNPLAPIRYASRLFRAGTPLDMIEDAGRMVERQLAHMARLLDDLLDVSRITRGALEVRRELLDLRSVIEASTEAARPLAEKSDQRLDLRLPATPLPVCGDGTRLSQVLGNVLDNATKYTHAGGHVVVEAHATADEVLVEIRDDGIGIPSELLPRIFELFTQGERSGRATSGLGIGLALARRLAKLHGGELEAHSAGPGTGSRFTLRLPRAPETQAVAGRVARPGKIEALRAAGARVLIVDDNVDAADALAHVMQLAGCTTRVVYDGASALEVAEELRPGVVLLDLGLPDVSGHEVARRLRAQPWATNLRLVAVTGWGQEDDRRKSRDAGFDEHYTKPVDPELLLRLAAEVARSTAQRPAAN